MGEAEFWGGLSVGRVERERFNTDMRTLNHERPGTKADLFRKAMFAAESERKRRSEDRIWREKWMAVAEVESLKRRERAERERRTREYKKGRRNAGLSSLKDAA